MDLHKSYIFAEILADTVHWGVDGMQAEVEIDEYQCTIGLKKPNHEQTSYTDAELQEFEAIIVKNESRKGGLKNSSRANFKWYRKW